MIHRASNRCVKAAVLALIGVGCLETVNTVRILRAPMEVRPFPQGYFSKGVLSAYALVRPLDKTSTDLVPLVRAARFVLHGHADLYAGFGRDGASFIYPPSAAFLFAPLGWIAETFGEVRAVQAMDGLGRLCVACLVVISCRFMCCELRRFRNWLAVVIALLAFYPNRWGLMCVQAQLVVNALLACALLAYANRYRTACGVLLGLAGAIKPHFLILVMFACFRKEWRIACWGALTACIAAAGSVALTGVGPWTAYIEDVIPVLAHGYAWVPNQSFLALVRRWEGDPTDFALTEASDFARSVAGLCSVIFLTVAIAPRRGASLPASRNRKMGRGESFDHPPGDCQTLGRALDFGVAALAVTLISPIAWEHHFGWTLVLFCACFAGIRENRTMCLAVLLASYVFLGSSWVPVAIGHPGPISVLNSLGLIAAVALLLVSWRAIADVARDEARLVDVA